ncbi:hypothetical protein [Nocardia tengchongensis]|uniref:hypothetical protein n=1 Tax=Nocardia tengchongensis TaxID=2055889 RepID=UPI00369AFD7B
MRPSDSGVIGVGAAGPDTSAIEVGSAPVSSSGPLPDLPLGTPRADAPPIEPPAKSALAQAAADPASALPPLPADPVGDLMKGLGVPTVPGLDALFAPFLQLLQSFGTGVLGRLNPATLLSAGSTVIEAAVQVGGGALDTVESLWQGKASQSAQESGKQAAVHGQETAQRGFDLSAIADQAAAVVERGNIQLTAIAQAFAAEATALAPLIVTPLGQTTLIASATRHLGEAVAVANATRGELSVYSAQVQGLIGQLVGQGSGPNPAEVAQALAQNVGRPILEQARGLLESGLLAVTPADTANNDPTRRLPDTSAAGLGGGGVRGSGGGPDGLGGSLPSTPGGPGFSIPGGKLASPATPFGTGAARTPGLGGATGSGFLGSPAAAGAGKGGAGEAQHGRTVQPHQSPTAESELTGNLGNFAPGVIGDIEDSGDAAELDHA